MRSIVVSVSVCLFVCLFVHSHISKSTRPNFAKFSVFVTCGLGSSPFSDGNAIYCVLPTLSIASCFHIMQGIGQNQRGRVCFVQFARWRHRCEVCLFIVLIIVDSECRTVLSLG